MFALLRPPPPNMGISALPSQIGIWGSVISSPQRSGAELRPKTGLGAFGTLKNTSDGDKFRIFATNIHPHFYDWEPIRSIFDILHKNFQEDQLNSRRIPGGFLNSRFPGFPGVVDTLIYQSFVIYRYIYGPSGLFHLVIKKLQDPNRHVFP